MANQWFPFYPGDYGRDTGRLSLLDHGAYFLLLNDYYSTGGPLPLDTAEIFLICKAFKPDEQKAAMKILATFFVETAEGYRNTRADRELTEQAVQQEKRKQKAQKGAAARWRKEDETPHPEKMLQAMPQASKMPQVSKNDAPSIENECSGVCLSNATTTTTTVTTTDIHTAIGIEKLIRDCVEERRQFIRDRFGFNDNEIEIEVEEIVVKCNQRSPGPDVWLYISRWFKNRRGEINVKDRERTGKTGTQSHSGTNNGSDAKGGTLEDFVDHSDKW